MTLLMRDQEMMQKGREEGREQGRIDTLITFWKMVGLFRKQKRCLLFRMRIFGLQKADDLPYRLARKIAKFDFGICREPAIAGSSMLKNNNFRRKELL